MNQEKADFLQQRLPALLRTIPSDRTPSWGRMTAQQMVEHLSEAFRIASGKIVFAEILTPQGQIEKMQAFLRSDKPFRENTPNALLPEVPPPVRNTDMGSAIAELETEIAYFFAVFRKNGLQLTRNPFFGDLNGSDNVDLLHKHAVHHLRQFGVGSGES